MSDGQDASNGAVGAGNKAAQPDPLSIPLDELGKAINSDPEATRLGTFEPEQSAAEDDPVEEQEDQAVGEPEDDTEAPAEADATETEDDDESEVEEPALDPEIELLQRQVSKLERTLSSREGKYGNQQQKIDRLLQENAALRARLDGDDLGGVPEATERSEPSRSSDDGVRGYLVEQAVANTLTSFIAEHPGLEKEPGFVQAVQSLRATADFSNDPRQVQQEVRSLLENAADDFRVAQLREQRKQKRAEQAESLRKKKRATALSSSSSRSEPAKPKTPDPRKMSLDDLRKSIESGLAG